MANIFKRIADLNTFQNFILFVIIFAAVFVGIQTYPDISKSYRGLFGIFDMIIIGIFTVEIFIRIAAFGKQPWNFFKGAWNIFDFLITVVFYLPFGGGFAAILRLARVFRVLRLVTAIPRLQILVGALIKSMPSMGYIAILLFILFYFFATIGNHLFGENDPKNFGNCDADAIPDYNT
ncbi:MAG: ion transporter [Candidatus Aenigmarchaeota archaeon]|nr:ion transporter [Candidatus Aenigmarchaeota archaeon]